MGIVTILYGCGSVSDFGKVSVTVSYPVPDPNPKPDVHNGFGSANAKSCGSGSTTMLTRGGYQWWLSLAYLFNKNSCYCIVVDPDPELL